MNRSERIPTSHYDTYLPALNASSALILVTLLLACPTVMRFFRVIFDKRVAKLDLAPAKKQKKRHRFEK